MIAVSVVLQFLLLLLCFFLHLLSFITFISVFIFLIITSLLALLSFVNVYTIEQLSCFCCSVPAVIAFVYKSTLNFDLIHVHLCFKMVCLHFFLLQIFTFLSGRTIRLTIKFMTSFLYFCMFF